VDSTIEPGVIMSSPSPDQIQVRALDYGHGNTTGAAPNTGLFVGNAPLGGAGSSKGESFLDTPIHRGTRGGEKFYIIMDEH